MNAIEALRLSESQVKGVEEFLRYCRDRIEFHPSQLPFKDTETANLVIGWMSARLRANP